jgi:hypothetical protein
LSVIHFKTNYLISGGQYGAQISTTSPRITIIPLPTRICYTFFYMKTWTCPSLSFFDPAQDLCTTCPIINCINCLNLTVCSVCDNIAGYFLNSTTGQCDSCNVIGCINCTAPLMCL